MKVKCNTMLPTMMKTLMIVDFLRKMNHYSHCRMDIPGPTTPVVLGLTTRWAPGTTLLELHGA
jgi:hypothetical protein